MATRGDRRRAPAGQPRSGPGDAPGPDGGTATLHGVIAGAGGDRWSFTASVGMAQLGAKTRTITVESVRTIEGTPVRGKRGTPSGLFVDLLLDDKKLLLRHASESGGDPDYAADLDRCSFAREADGALATLVPPPAEPTEAVRKELKANPKIYPGADENNVSWVHLDIEHHTWFNP